MAQISDEINKYLKSISDNLELAQKEARKIIDTEAYKTFENIKKNTPIHSGDLKNSIYIIPLTGINTDHTRAAGRCYWGYKIGFRGETKNGVARDAIARVLNDGHGSYTNKSGKNFGAISGTHFISKELSKLKTLDGKIEDRIAQLVDEGKLD